MFEAESTESGVLTTGDMAAFLERLGAVGGESLDDAERVDQIGLLESIKGAAAAAQVRVTVAFDASQCAVQAAAGIRRRPTEWWGLGCR